MTINATGRMAWIAAGALVVLFAGPATATDGDNSAAGAAPESQAAAAAPHRTYRHVSHHRRHYAHRRVHPIAKADDAEKKAPSQDTATTTAASDNRPLAQIPPSIANANAQMLLAGAQLSAAATIPVGTNTPQFPTETANADGETVVAATDQLNDTDRTLQEGNSTAVAAANSPTQATTTTTSDSTVWDQTSLIGKIFIGFGALLTMASAARMFIT